MPRKFPSLGTFKAICISSEPGNRLEGDARCICHRKWYSRRVTGRLAPKDTNTSQLLAPLPRSRSLIRDRAKSKTLQRASQERVKATGDSGVSQKAERFEPWHDSSPTASETVYVCSFTGTLKRSDLRTLLHSSCTASRCCLGNSTPPPPPKRLRIGRLSRSSATTQHRFPE